MRLKKTWWIGTSKKLDIDFLDIFCNYKVLLVSLWDIMLPFVVKVRYLSEHGQTGSPTKTKIRLNLTSLLEGRIRYSSRNKIEKDVKIS